MLQPAAFDLVSAALRHARDAEWLASKANPNPSPDQAYHLAGYGPECARKATVRAPWLHRTIGHRFDQASDAVLDVAVALDPLALRYEPKSWATRFPALAAWREDVRYDRTGSKRAEQVEALLADCREAVDRVVVGLWADGLMPDGEAPW